MMKFTWLILKVKVQVPKHMDMKFGDLHRRVFHPDILPFKRCLAFHITQAYFHAKKEQWLRDDAAGFEFYGSEGSYNLQAWLHGSAAASVPDLEGPTL